MDLVSSFHLSAQLSPRCDVPSSAPARHENNSFSWRGRRRFLSWYNQLRTIISSNSSQKPLCDVLNLSTHFSGFTMIFKDELATPPPTIIGLTEGGPRRTIKSLDTIAIRRRMGAVSGHHTTESGRRPLRSFGQTPSCGENAQGRCVSHSVHFLKRRINKNRHDRRS